jgi:hypothetical protein
VAATPKVMGHNPKAKRPAAGAAVGSDEVEGMPLKKPDVVTRTFGVKFTVCEPGEFGFSTYPAPVPKRTLALPCARTPQGPIFRAPLALLNEATARFLTCSSDNEIPSGT